jgi:hypothetical protein
VVAVQTLPAAAGIKETQRRIFNQHSFVSAFIYFPTHHRESSLIEPARKIHNLESNEEDVQRVMEAEIISTLPSSQPTSSGKSMDGRGWRR